ncbi:MAG: rhomboid family intramembrane serine protease, partial [Solirubrobacterales bacterium]|nr:rhomboid family intramembrane serine protease [Solirubrobacterales bacterium]
MSTVPERKRQTQIEGIQLLAGIVALMWIVEVINSLDANKLDNDGIYPRNLGRLWGILTAPFLHAGFGHLIANTVPFVFMGLIIALRGAARLAAVTLIVIL